METTLKIRLKKYLKDNGFDYDFSLLDLDEGKNEYFYSEKLTRPYYKNYVSKTLQSVTGLINSSICLFDPHYAYDIDLMNRITECLLASGDEEFYYVAWNSFIKSTEWGDSRFILYPEFRKAKDKFLSMPFDLCVDYTNHTKELKTKRLIVRPLTCVDYFEVFDYVDTNEDFLREFICNFDPSQHCIVFTSVSKKSKEIISLIALDFYENKNERFTDIYLYTIKKYRKKGYIKEAFESILDALNSYKVIAYGEWYKSYVLEERPLNIKFLRFNIKDENNIAAFNTAKSLGFDYMGKNINDDQETYDWFIKKIGK